MEDMEDMYAGTTVDVGIVPARYEHVIAPRSSKCMRVAPTQLLSRRRVSEPHNVDDTRKAHVGAAYLAH